jgi:Gpi18-like mannosyltransferase
VFIKFLPSYNEDIEFWVFWAKTLYLNDFSKIYSATVGSRLECNYPPIILYLIKFLLLFCNSVEDISKNIFLLKIMTLFFDFSIIFYLLNKYYQNISLSKLFLILFNIALFYNTMLWGQTDSIFIVFFILSVLCFINFNFLLSGFFLALSLFTKFQVIIFMPVFLFLCLYFLRVKFSFKILIFFLGFFITSIIILLPFILNGNVGDVINVFLNSNGFYHNLSFNAHNFWCWLCLKPELVDDRSLIFNLLPLHFFGFFLYFFFFIIIFMLIFLNLNLKKLASSGNISELKLFFLFFSISTLLFFYFNTQMHERYSFASLYFLCVYFILSKNIFLFVLNSIVYFLNIEGVGRIIAQSLGLIQKNQNIDKVNLSFNPHYELVFSSELFVSFLFAILIVCIYFEILKQLKLINLKI